MAFTSDKGLGVHHPSVCATYRGIDKVILVVTLVVLLDELDLVPSGGINVLALCKGAFLVLSVLAEVPLYFLFAFCRVRNFWLRVIKSDSKYKVAVSPLVVH